MLLRFQVGKQLLQTPSSLQIQLHSSLLLLLKA